MEACVCSGTCIAYAIAGDAEAELQDKCCWMGAQQ